MFETEEEEEEEEEVDADGEEVETTEEGDTGQSLLNMWHDGWCALFGVL